eukprot:c3062_g1_i1.p1 GENE.c3062_g1_i1~~c3062_g1_i1.p1  ORF type:complete len:180 (-),score=66.49 c3062_g1_i1:1-540(-)
MKQRAQAVREQYSKTRSRTVTFSEFIFEDGPIILVGLINFGFFLCCVIGLSLVPYGRDKIPPQKLALQATVCTWTLVSSLLCLIGSALRSSSFIFCTMAFTSHVIAALTCGAFMLSETLYVCRHCAGMTDESCKDWYSQCDVAYGAYLFGTVGTLVCQYLMLFVSKRRRDTVLDRENAN